MLEQFERTALLIGEDAIKKLQNSKVAIFGIGGVGSFVAEALVRAGVGNFILIDFDTIVKSNINRQIHATYLTVGKYKVDVMKERILQINPKAKVEIKKDFYKKGLQKSILDESVSYVVDAIDSIKSKIDLIVEAKEKNIPIMSSMGAGNKLDPTKFEITDIYKTSVCPIAKILRKELKQKGIKKLKVVYSTEIPNRFDKTPENMSTTSSISFVPSVAGLIIASEVVKDIINM